MQVVLFISIECHASHVEVAAAIGYGGDLFRFAAGQVVAGVPFSEVVGCGLAHGVKAGGKQERKAENGRAKPGK